MVLRSRTQTDAHDQIPHPVCMLVHVWSNVNAHRTPMEIHATQTLGLKKLRHLLPEPLPGKNPGPGMQTDGMPRV
eukprot:9134105-Lingulodinium_polyedra.AAC.1